MIEAKECRRCRETQPAENFTKHPSTHDRLSHICRQCKSQSDRERRDSNVEFYRNKANAREQKWCDDNPIQRLLRQAYRRSRRKGVEFSLSEEDINIPDMCPYLGIPIFRGRGKVCANSPSVDEIVPGSGYVKGNVQVISAKANAMKNDASPEQLLRFSKRIVEQFADKE